MQHLLFLFNGVLAMGLFGTAPDFVMKAPAQYRADNKATVQFDSDAIARACAGGSTIGEQAGNIVACAQPGLGIVPGVMHLPNPHDWPDKYAKVIRPVVDKGSDTKPVSFDSPEELAKACAAALACIQNGVAHVPNPNGYTDPYAQVISHELGHINRWPANHPVDK